MINSPHIIIDGRHTQQALIRQAEELLTSHPEEWAQHIARFLLDWFNKEAEVAVQTSGSTGTPKTIRLKKKQMQASARMTGEFFGLKKGEPALLCMSAHYIAGKMMIVRALELQLQLICIAPSGNPVQHLNNTPIRFAAMVPLQVYNALYGMEHDVALNHIQTLIIGGGAVNESLRKQLDRLQTACFATYGMTETITHIAVRRLNGDMASPYYTTLPGISIATDDRDCLVIEAPHLSEEKVVTNDVVEMEDFHLFRWLGRYDNVINSGGIKLHPELLEKKLEEVLDRRFFFAGQAHDKLGQQLHLYIEGTPFDAGTMALFKAHIADELDKYERPAEIHFIAHFEETGSGKVNRLATAAKAY